MGQVGYLTITNHCCVSLDDFLHDTLLQLGMDDGTVFTQDLWVALQSVKKALELHAFDLSCSCPAVENETVSVGRETS